MGSLVGKEGQMYGTVLTGIYGMCAQASAVPMGRVVVLGTDDNTCRLPDRANVLGFGATAADADDVVGISVYQEKPTDINPHILDKKYISDANTGTYFYDEKQPVSIATKNPIFVRTETPVVPNGKVFYRVELDESDETKMKLGSIRGDDDGGKCVELKGVRFVIQSAMAGGIAIVDLSMMSKG